MDDSRTLPTLYLSAKPFPTVFSSVWHFVTDHLTAGSAWMERFHSCQPGEAKSKAVSR